MRASLSDNWLFLANPRCGSTRLRAALTPLSDLVSRNPGEGPIRHHWTASEAAAYLTTIGRDIATFDAFTTVRNPWARAASAYVSGGQNPASIWGSIRAEAPDFARFIRHPGFSSHLHALDAFVACNGKRAVGHVFAMECLEEEAAAVSGIIGHRVAVPRCEQIPAYDYRTFFSDDDAAWIRVCYERDIDLFGYAFDRVDPQRSSLGPPDTAVASSAIEFSPLPIVRLSQASDVDSSPTWQIAMHAKGQSAKWGDKDPADPRRRRTDDILKEGHHSVYGRPWMFGRLLFEQLLRRGLRPKHDVLDVGCGVGRLGIWLVPFLQPGRYVGVESHRKSLEIFAGYEAALHDLARKQPLLVEDAEFQFGSLGRTFDAVLDFCVTIHLTPEWRRVAFQRMRASLKPGGRIFLAQAPELPADELRQLGLAITHREHVRMPVFDALPKEHLSSMDWHELEAVS